MRQSAPAPLSASRLKRIVLTFFSVGALLLIIALTTGDDVTSVQVILPTPGNAPANTLAELHSDTSQLTSTDSTPELEVESGTVAPETTVMLQTDYSSVALEDIVGDRWDMKPRNGRATCELMLLGHEKCHVRTGKETAEQCIERYGFENWNKVMPIKCRNSDYWASLAERERNPSTRRSRIPIEADGTDFVQLRDRIVREQYVHSSPSKQHLNPKKHVMQAARGAARHDYVPPHKRKVADYGPPRRCSKPGTFVHPISFGVPEGNIIEKVSRIKLFPFLPYTPRLFPPWKFPPGPYRLGPNDEYLASVMHQHSYFAFTHKRGGWDCLRHVEQLAHGVVPYWADLENCGKYCMAVMPKALLFEAMELPGVRHIGRQKRGEDRVNTEYFDKPSGQHLNFKKPGTIRFDEFDQHKYFDLADKLLNHTKHHLTTSAMVAYVLRSIGFEEPKSVLLIQPAHQDFLTQGIESGLGDLGLNWTTNVEQGEGDPPHRAMTRVDIDDLNDNKDPRLDDNFTVSEFESVREARGNRIQLHGVGAVNGMRLWTPPKSNRISKNNIGAALRERHFDLVIYTQWHGPSERLPFFSDVREGVPLDRVVVMDGADDRAEPESDTRELLSHGIKVFRREMHEHAHC